MIVKQVRTPPVRPADGAGVGVYESFVPGEDCRGLGLRQGPPHLRLETISGRNGPCPVPRKPPPESSVPGEKLTRGSRRNQLRRGHGSPPVLSEVPYELRTDAHSKECKRSPQQFIPAGFPPPRQPIHGDGRLSQPPHHTGHGPFRTRPPNLS